MPSHFIVSTKVETPNLYVSQRDLNVIVDSLRTWSGLHDHTGWVFAPRMITPFGSQIVGTPADCAQLALVSVVRPYNQPRILIGSWGNSVDDMPYEMALEEIQDALDYIERKRLSVEARNARTEEKSETTGT